MGPGPHGRSARDHDDTAPVKQVDMKTPGIREPESEIRNPASVRAVLQEAAGRLREAGADSPRLDAELLLASCLAWDRSRLLAHVDRPLGPSEARGFWRLVDRRCTGEPVAWLTGVKEFHGLPISVAPGVFVPRPETEGLVDLAFQEEGRESQSAVDACTGSGNVAIALALEGGFARVEATEISRDALRLARRNASALGAEVAFFEGSLLAPLLEAGRGGAVDVVCANPPYIRRGDLARLPAEVRREPVLALDGGEDGLDVVRELLAQAQALLKLGGRLLVEIGEDQGEACAGIAEAEGFAEIEVKRDLAGRERYLTCVSRKTGA